MKIGSRLLDGWVRLHSTKDKNIRYRTTELESIRRNAARIIVILAKRHGVGRPLSGIGVPTVTEQKRTLRTVIDIKLST